MTLLPTTLRRRGCLLFVAAIFLVPFSLLVLVSGPDISSEQSLAQRLAELQMRLQFLESQYRARQEDIALLSQQLGSQGDNASSSAQSQLLEGLSPETRAALRNVTGQRGGSGGLNVFRNLRLPTAFHFLPHLLDDPQSLKPAYLVSRGRSGVSVALGVPTVKRDKQSYLMTTLQNLIDAMTDSEAADTVIIVFVAETDMDYVQLVSKQIELRFTRQVIGGLIEVLSPHPAYYPNMDKLRITLNDPIERVKWRSKQNLDFAFLMTYAQPKATFYVQLEDDILAKRGFITTMKNFALEKTTRKEPWFALDFCQLGFIGKMFKSAELPWLITFFQMFYNDKPVDWLLDHLISTKICNWEKDAKHCKQEKSKVWMHYKPSLFQHIGTHSSLKGKTQKLKDKQFGKVPLFFPHANPPAEVSSDITPYKQLHSLVRAYRGEGFFWGLLPEPGDKVVFAFKEPIALRRYLFRSGNAEHPSDRFYNTTVEVLPSSTDIVNLHEYNITSDGYVIVGQFDGTGVAEGKVDGKIGRVSVIRLTVHTESENWAILNEAQFPSKNPQICHYLYENYLRQPFLMENLI